MPQRTNDFQRLILLINKLLPGAKVTESAMLPSRVDSGAREVDILVEAPVSNAAKPTVKIAFECIDHKRPADVVWVESKVEKYRDIRVDVVILVSSSGFTARARNKAEFEGITALSLSSHGFEAEATAALSWDGNFSACYWDLDFAILLLDTGEEMRVLPESHVFIPSTQQRMTLQVLSFEALTYTQADEIDANLKLGEVRHYMVKVPTKPIPVKHAKVENASVVGIKFFFRAERVGVSLKSRRVKFNGNTYMEGKGEGPFGEKIHVVFSEIDGMVLTAGQIGDLEFGGERARPTPLTEQEEV